MMQLWHNVSRWLLPAGVMGWLMVGALAPASAQFGGSQPVKDSLKAGFDTISDEQSEAWLSIIAGPEFAGRGTGQAGYTKAAHWVAGKLAEFGLEPIGDGGSYFQSLEMTRSRADMTESKITGPNDLTIAGEAELGFDNPGSEPHVVGEVVFVNITGRQQGMPEGQSLRDKVVVLVSDKSAGPFASFMVRRQRPLALINVVEGKPQSRSQVTQSRGGRRTGLQASISIEAADRLAKAVGGEETWVHTTEKPGIDIHATTEEITIHVRSREEPVLVPNVVGWLPGSDPELRHEYITLGAHLDHLGERSGSTYPGADDNGSGSTAILSVARALSENPVKPKRSVLFIWFAAEEIGLVGSRYYTEHPLKPMEDMVCMFNIDMIGRNEEKDGEPASENTDTIHLVGSKKGDSGLHELVTEANKNVQFKFEYDEEGVFGRSDQANFYRKGVPVAFLFGGFSPYYHQTTDGLNGINFHKITSCARLFYVAIYLASEHGKYQLKEEGS